MDFEGLKQIFKFEVSRFPFLSEERQKSLRRAYRELEAVLRSAVRELEYGWGGTRFVPPRVLSARLGKVADDLQGTCGEYGSLLSSEMRKGLENLCEHLRWLKQQINIPDPKGRAALKELTQGLDELKRALGTIHRL